MDDISNMGSDMVKGSPFSIYLMLSKLGQQIPGMQDAMRLLGIGQQQRPPQNGPQYRIDQPLPRSGGVDAQGNPIISPAGGGMGMGGALAGGLGGSLGSSGGGSYGTVDASQFPGGIPPPPPGVTY